MLGLVNFAHSQLVEVIKAKYEGIVDSYKLIDFMVDKELAYYAALGLERMKNRLVELLQLLYYALGQSLDAEVEKRMRSVPVGKSRGWSKDEIKRLYVSYGNIIDSIQTEIRNGNIDGAIRQTSFAIIHNGIVKESMAYLAVA